MTTPVECSEDLTPEFIERVIVHLKLNEGEPTEAIALIRALAARAAAPAPVIEAIFETVDPSVPLTGHKQAPVKRVDHQDDDSFTVVIDHWPAAAPVDVDELLEALEEISAPAPHSSESGRWRSERARAALTQHKGGA